MLQTQDTLFFQNTVPQSQKDLREYQHEAVESIFEYFTRKTGNPLIVIPTGGGKSLILADFISRAQLVYPGTRFVVLSHVSELLKQDAEELLAHNPTARICFYSASLKQKRLDAEVVFASIQSIYKKAYDFKQAPDLILIDEAHLLSPDDATMYRAFLKDMLVVNPNIKIVGFTATPFRSNYGRLHEGKNALFTDIAYEVPILKLIELGHLCELVTPQVNTKMDVSGVKISKGDYVVKQLSAAIDKDHITKAFVDEMMLYATERKRWLVFTADIAHCEHVAAEISGRGIVTTMVHSRMEDEDKRIAIEKFRTGEVQCMVNVSMLTTGFNVPAIDLMAFCRPTRSPVLYIQSAGRGMRTFPGKENCVLLDFGGVVESLGPIDCIQIKQKKFEEDGEAPTKMCQHCGATCHAACRECPNCGGPFPETERDLDHLPTSEAVLSHQMKPQRYEVTRVSYARHKKEGKPDSIRIDYLCGLNAYSEWTLLSHKGFPQQKAAIWWLKRSPGSPVPGSTDEGLDRLSELAKPTVILVRRIGKYHEICGYEFGEENAPDASAKNKSHRGA